MACPDGPSRLSGRASRVIGISPPAGSSDKFIIFYFPFFWIYEALPLKIPTGTRTRTGKRRACLEITPPPPTSPPPGRGRLMGSLTEGLSAAPEARGEGPGGSNSNFKVGWWGGTRRQVTAATSDFQTGVSPQHQIGILWISFGGSPHANKNPIGGPLPLCVFLNGASASPADIVLLAARS